MSAETGVGPAIASPSHACSGSWADLPHAASRSSRPIAVVVPWSASPAEPSTVAKSTPPNVASMNIIAAMRPMSPTRFMTNAFLPATAFGRWWSQNPMSR